MLFKDIVRTQTLAEYMHREYSPTHTFVIIKNIRVPNEYFYVDVIVEIDSNSIYNCICKDEDKTTFKSFEIKIKVEMLCTPNFINIDKHVFFNNSFSFRSTNDEKKSPTISIRIFEELELDIFDKIKTLKLQHHIGLITNNQKNEYIETILPFIDDVEACSICLENTISKTHCGHYLCIQCNYKLQSKAECLHHSYICPICRTYLDPYGSDHDENDCSVCMDHDDHYADDDD